MLPTNCFSLQVQASMFFWFCLASRVSRVAIFLTFNIDMAHEASCPSDAYWNASLLRDALLRSRDFEAAVLRSPREYLRDILKNLCDIPVAEEVLKSCSLDDKIIALSHLEDVWVWMQKVDAVKLQSYCDSAYSNFRSTMRCDSFKSESVRRSECLRDNYCICMRHYKTMRSF